MKKLVFWLVFVVLLPIASAGSIESPLFGLDMASFYSRNYYAVDFFLYLILFLGVATLTVGKHFKGKEGRAVSIAVGLSLTFGMLTWARMHDFRLGNVGPYTALLLLVVLSMLIFKVLKLAEVKNTTATLITFLAILIASQAVMPSIAGADGLIARKVPIAWAALNAFFLAAVVLLVAGIFTEPKDSSLTPSERYERDRYEIEKDREELDEDKGKLERDRRALEKEEEEREAKEGKSPGRSSGGRRSTDRSGSGRGGRRRDDQDDGQGGGDRDRDRDRRDENIIDMLKQLKEYIEFLEECERKIESVRAEINQMFQLTGSEFAHQYMTRYPALRATLNFDIIECRSIVRRCVTLITRVRAIIANARARGALTPQLAQVERDVGGLETRLQHLAEYFRREQGN